MCKDPIRGTIWVYTSKAVFKYKVSREARDVWQMYLDSYEFDLAKTYCEVSKYTFLSMPIAYVCVLLRIILLTWIKFSPNRPSISSARSSEYTMDIFT
jgi:hypothetical protein